MSSPAPVEPAARPPQRRRWVVLLGLVVLAGAGWLGGRHVWAWSHRRAAGQCLEHYEFEEALAHLECCLRVWPVRQATRLEAARTARRAGRLERAEELLAACEEGGIGPATALERALLTAQRGDLAEVEGPLRRQLAEDHPDSLLILETLAQGGVASRRFDLARQTLDQLIRRAPEHPWAYYWRGNLFHMGGSVLRALPEFQRAVELAPRRVAFRLRLAQALVETNQAREAWPHLEELLAHSPDDPEVQLGAARCLRALTQPARALEYLDQLLRAHPDHAEAWAERGRVSSDQGDAAEALRCLRRAFELDPYSYPIGFALFSELRSQGLSEEARAVRRRVEALKRDEDRMQELMGQLKPHERNPAIRCEIGTIFLRSKVEGMALTWFFAALRDDPNHRPTHEALADYYQGKGNTEAAAYHRQRAGKR